MRNFGLAVLLATFAITVSRGQQAGQAALPSTPTASLPSAPLSKPSFALPPAVYTPPTAPVADDKKKLVCDGPREGLYALPIVSEAESKTGEALSYRQLMMSQIYTTWLSHLPHEARDAWAKGCIVRVRFVVMEDGSYSSPEVTISSGKSSYDYAAVAAVNSRSAFPPLPATLTKPLAFCMTFKSNTELPDTPQGWYGPAIK